MLLAVAFSILSGCGRVSKPATKLSPSPISSTPVAPMGYPGWYCDLNGTAKVYKEPSNRSQLLAEVGKPGEPSVIKLADDDQAPRSTEGLWFYIVSVGNRSDAFARSQGLPLGYYWEFHETVAIQGYLFNDIDTNAASTNPSRVVTECTPPPQWRRPSVGAPKNSGNPQKRSPSAKNAK